MSADPHPAVSSGRAGAYLYACHAEKKRLVSSSEISDLTGINATQVRRDLSQLLGRTSHGKRGGGYPRERLALLLREQIVARPGAGSGAAVLIAAIRAGTAPSPPDLWLHDGATELGGLLGDAAALAAEIDALLVADR